MEILRSLIFIKCHLLRTSYRINRLSSRNALDLAHKIHGNLTSDHPVLVLHGLLGSKRNWESMCKKIASSTSKAVVAADLRNHGESPHANTHSYQELMSDVLQLMNKLSINSANIIGHSMGGRTAMVLALSEPSKVLKLIAVDISPVSTAGILNDFFPRLMEVMKTVDFTGLEPSQARQLAKEKIRASGLIEHDALMAFIIMNVGKKYDGTLGWQCNIDALSRNFQEIGSFPDLSGKRYDGPVLFIGGDQSNYIPPGDITGIRGLFPKAELQYVQGAGHNVHADTPDAFLAMPEKVSSFISVDISPVSMPDHMVSSYPRFLDFLATLDFKGITDVEEARRFLKEKLHTFGVTQSEIVVLISRNVGMKSNKIGWLCDMETLKESYPELLKFPNIPEKIYLGPTLFIGAGLTDFIPPEDLRGIKRLFPRAQLQYVPGVRHNVHEKDPTTFLRMATEFLFKHNK